MRGGGRMWLEQLLSRWCHDFGVTGLWSDKPRHDLRLVGPSGFVSPWTAAATRGRLGIDRDGWTPARVQVELGPMRFAELRELLIDLNALVTPPHHTNDAPR